MQQPAIPSTSTCRNCGAPRPSTARFCPECGARLDVEEVATPVRRFGAPPANLLLWLATAILAAAVVLLAVALWLPGIVLVFVAAIVAAAHAGRRHRRETSRALVRVRTRSRAVVETVAAQAQARREQLALRVELQRLLGERNDRLRALGEAVYREDAAGTEAARAALVELDGQVAA
ncbi:MAG TPA: zinc ribbon domain-containing protein, partial [Gaiellaceae bacterium]|nr:zinc ribbon domain-containing protein [Gaiellaceae bacterium]